MSAVPRAAWNNFSISSCHSREGGNPVGKRGWILGSSPGMTFFLFLEQEYSIGGSFVKPASLISTPFGLSSEPFVEHPLQTAYILAELQLDSASLAAALLHDIPEETGLPIADVSARFGPEIAKLVDAVTH